MKNKSRKMLPKTAAEIANGGIYRQSVRCGKRSCRCAVGDLHQGYFYFIRREEGRLRKTYVPRGKVKALSTMIRQARGNREAERAIRRSSRSLLSELRARLREYDPIISNLAGALKHGG